MTRVITAHEATVKTAAVNVKALTISGKQVTLSVFRQLKDESLLDSYTGELLGVPWGTVNYYFGGCENDHLHVVWQKGDELRRSCVYPRRRSGDYTDAAQLDERHKDWQRVAWLVAAGDLLDLWGETKTLPTGDPALSKIRVTGVGTDWGEIGPQMVFGDALFSILKTDWSEVYIEDKTRDDTIECGDPRIVAGCRPKSNYGCSHYRVATPEERQDRLHEMQSKRIDALKEQGRELMNGGAPPGREELSRAIASYWETRRAREARNATWASHYAEIEALDQLFIAV